VGVLNERRGFEHLDFWSKPVFGALFVFYRARFGLVAWDGMVHWSMGYEHTMIELE
jgi:hypothetical protein